MIAMRKSALPRPLEPQLATLVTRPPRGRAWLHEVKLDGYRILARVDRGHVVLFSRNGAALVAEVAFTNRTRDGRLRHPTFQGLREDKRPSQVIDDEPSPQSGTRRRP